MSHVRWVRPVDEIVAELHRPVLIASFAGWNNAGEAATTATGYLAGRWGAGTLARIDADPFFDFTQQRPMIELADGTTRQVSWPTNDFEVASPDDGPDVVVLTGIEPHLRWRQFCESVVEVARAIDASMIVTLGALMAEVHHAHPISVVGTSTDAELMARLDLQPSSYEGPTGIVGVLQSAATDAGIPAASLWAAVPIYLPNATSPKAALALVQRTVGVLGISYAATDLQIASAAYERQVNELLADDDEAAEYAARIEAEVLSDDLGIADVELDEELSADPEALIDEVEQFLRNQSD